MYDFQFKRCLFISKFSNSIILPDGCKFCLDVRSVPRQYYLLSGRINGTEAFSNRRKKIQMNLGALLVV